MKNFHVLACVVAGLAISLASASGDADQRKDVAAKHPPQDQAHVQQQKEDRLHDNEPIRKKASPVLKDEDIYGHELMSPEELNQYRERHRLIKTEEERKQLETRHRKEMQRRAQALGIEIEDAD